MALGSSTTSWSKTCSASSRRIDRRALGFPDARRSPSSGKTQKLLFHDVGDHLGRINIGLSQHGDYESVAGGEKPVCDRDCVEFIPDMPLLLALSYQGDNFIRIRL